MNFTKQKVCDVFILEVIGVRLQQANVFNCGAYPFLLKDEVISLLFVLKHLRMYDCLIQVTAFTLCIGLPLVYVMLIFLAGNFIRLVLGIL